MNNKRGIFSGMLSLYFILLLLMFVMTGISAFVSIKLMIILAAITFFAAVFVGIRISKFQRTFSGLSSSLKKSTEIKSQTLSSFSFPVVYTSETGEILWYSDEFKKYLDTNHYGDIIYDIMPIDKDKLENDGFCDTFFNGCDFTLYRSSNVSLSKHFIFYLVDNTEFKQIKKAYTAEKPVCMLIACDNFNEVLYSAKDSEKSSFRSAFHKEIENWLADIHCVNINISGDKVFVIMEQKDLDSLITTKFSVLEKIRKICINDISGLRISIGIGRGGSNLDECHQLCIQALDMAQSRGGDQAVIKSTGNDFRFFGGKGGSVEKRTKIRVKTVASALSEMFLAADKIIFVGHAYSDFDALGASYALNCAARSMGISSYIVFDPQRTMAMPLYKYIIANDHNTVFTDGKDLPSIITNRSLLVVLDSHRASFIDNHELYDACKNVIVIDHHRKAPDAIDNAVIFYHETAASSTCEMVTELLQYMDIGRITSVCADALLSGIMLDTKNYCLHTGVRTFEASAYLRTYGANPVNVKKLFSDDVETYIRKTSIVSSAKMYDDCAVSFDDNNDAYTRVATSQAADELLYLKGVNASFVMCRFGEKINISARSLGDVNVQLIVEQLGGGGHRNMAACQIDTDSFEKATELLLDAVKNYKESI